MADDEVKLNGQRRAIREHIEKWKRYPSDYDKEFALKTVSRAQEEIRKIKRKNTRASTSWEDDWRPGDPEY